MKKIKGLLTGENIVQFLSYFCVGGIAAIVEWVMFFFFSTLLRVEYLYATVCAFVFSTFANWLLGRTMTFKHNKKYKGKEIKELFLVFFVSAIGLGLNLVLMYVFVSIMGLNTDFRKLCCKIVSTGIVFFWNFFIRKLVIYK